jgi:16S rRNA (cytosine967-C5)-methyltransferase
MQISPARWAAFQALMDVGRGRQAAPSLERAAAGLDARDAALATEIVFGVLRRKGQLDWIVQSRTKRTDPETLIALEMGLYQKLFLTRIPPHAAVSESVELVHRAGNSFAARMVNAVLRRVHDVPPEMPRAAALSMPAWLLERWDREYGAEEAARMARAGLERSEVYVRGAGGEGCEATEVPGCWRVTGAPPAGARVMDIGSQALALTVRAKPGDLVLDACAAPGNKTAVLLESGGRVVAGDVSRARLCGFLAAGAALVQFDGTRALPFGPVFDWILVDAPCSGTGTLARNPEIKWRLKPEDLERHAGRQAALVQRALESLKPGGRLVYSTCSLEPEENQGALERAGARRVEQVLARRPGRDAGDGFQAFVISS